MEHKQIDFEIPRGMGRHIKKVFDGEYEITGVSLDSDNPPVFLDIGANAGAFCLWALREYRGAKIYAYEPADENWDILKRNVGSLPGVKIEKAAVMDKRRTVTIEPGQNNSGETAVCADDKTGETVQAVAAKDLPQCDWLKLDCEGCESLILSEYLRTHEPPDVITLEWHGTKRRQNCRRAIDESGYEVTIDVRTGDAVGLIKAVRPEFSCFKARPRPKDRRFFFPIPSYGGATPQFLRSLMKMRDYGLQFDLCWVHGDSHVDRARCKCVEQFMQSDHDRLLFIDDDIEFEPHDIVTLLEADRDIVCGLYPKKKAGPPSWVANTFLGEPHIEEGFLQKVRESGTGCMLVKRRVFEKMREAFPQKSYFRDATGDDLVPEFAYFESGVRYDPHLKKRRWLSEDWWFCQEAQEMGFDVWVDLRVKLKHRGMIDFPVTDESKPDDK